MLHAQGAARRATTTPALMQLLIQGRATAKRRITRAPAPSDVSGGVVSGVDGPSSAGVLTD